jgi:peptidoglycan/LPS O-acetylase OafA/YrhL
VAPPAGNARFPLFDGLRAIAALTVFLSHVLLASEYHAGRYVGPTSSVPDELLNHMDWGVAIFFIISGFLLYRPFVTARWHLAPATPVRTFWRRRVLRVIPAYWLALTVLAIYPGLGFGLGGAWPYYSLLHIYSPQTSTGGLAVSWTLCVEASFYLLLPLFALGMARLTRAAAPRLALRRELAVLTGLALVSVAGHVYVTNGGHTASLFYLTRTLPLNLDWFALGMALALASVAGREVFREACGSVGRLLPLGGSALWWGATAAFWLACVAIESRHPYEPLRHVLFGLAAFCLAVPAVFEARGLVARVLGDQRLAWLGLISYGIYLWQLQLLSVLHNWGLDAGDTTGGMVLLGAVGFVFTVTVAAASYYLLEKPILAYKYRHVRGAESPERGVGAARPQEAR